MNLRSRTDVGVVAPLDGISLGSPGRAVHDCVGPEVPVPQAKPWLVCLAPFSIESRTLRRPGTARERVLAALGEFGVEAGGEFAMRDVYGQIGIVTGTKEHGAVQRAIDRMYRGGRGRAPELERVGVGGYRRMGQVPSRPSPKGASNPLPISGAGGVAPLQRER